MDSDGLEVDAEIRNAVDAKKRMYINVGNTEKVFQPSVHHI
ncbi:hypothetical protein [Thermogymnomonas acidicola]|nr:hypothetical protein [Thermogymnomonas acidicola]